MLLYRPGQCCRVLCLAVLLFACWGPRGSQGRWTTKLSKAQEHCHRESEYGKAEGCQSSYKCPKNSCARNGVKCIKNFSDCICKTGYYSPRPMRNGVFDTYQLGAKRWKGTAALQKKMTALLHGDTGECRAIKEEFVKKP